MSSLNNLPYIIPDLLMLLLMLLQLPLHLFILLLSDIGLLLSSLYLVACSNNFSSSTASFQPAAVFSVGPAYFLAPFYSAAQFAVVRQASSFSPALGALRYLFQRYGSHHINYIIDLLHLPLLFFFCDIELHCVLDLMICYECPNNFISHEYLQLLPLLF
jgi:hypothetical protein